MSYMNIRGLRPGGLRPKKPQSRRLTAGLFIAHRDHEGKHPIEVRGGVDSQSISSSVWKDVMGKIEVQTFQHFSRRLNSLCISDRMCVPLMGHKLWFIRCKLNLRAQTKCVMFNCNRHQWKGLRVAAGCCSLELVCCHDDSTDDAKKLGHAIIAHLTISVQ
eukprot:338752-Pelagomonas_calceolata.AAC.2